mmetsp:Transcript_13504/g.40279  ORF Transcript_13504/g.40279 Transcript_13504/m.40279 type:complete len:252 (+) Transcript_13504:122-877(+)
MLVVDVVHGEGDQDEVGHHEPSHDASLQRGCVRQVRRGSLVLVVELDNHPQGAAEEEHGQADQHALHREVAPRGHVLVEVVEGRGLEARGAAGHEPDGVVRLRHTYVRGDHVEEEHNAQNDERDELEELVLIVDVEIGDIHLCDIHSLLHVEDVVHRVLHHEARDHGQAGEGGQPVVDHVVEEEARVVRDLHRLGLDEIGRLQGSLNASEVRVGANPYHRHPLLVHLGGQVRPATACVCVQDRARGCPGNA